MKKIAALFVLLAYVSAAASISIQDPLLKVEIAKYSPFPVEPGKFLTLWIKAENVGGNGAKNAVFTLEPEYPLKLLENGTKNYGLIDSGADVLLEYRFAVDADAPDGLANVKFYYSLGGTGRFVKNFTVAVEKSKNQSDLRALFVDAIPQPAAGGKTTLTVDVANAASGMAYYVIARAKTPAGEIRRSSIYVGNLGPDDFDSMDFDIDVGNVTAGIYPVNVDFEYKDKDDRVHTAGDIVYIKVAPPVEGSAGTPLLMYAAYAIIAAALAKFVILPLRRRKK
ncbi:MAG TPA: hypothetical protein VI979_01240 [archaeon]|nr:hypothetical protein [archaeon]